jgi:hypothetical protein
MQYHGRLIDCCAIHEVGEYAGSMEVAIIKQSVDSTLKTCDVRTIKTLWCRARITGWGFSADIASTNASLDPEDTDQVAVFSPYVGKEFPSHLRASFSRHFLPNASCAICDLRPASISFRRVRLDNSTPKGKWYVVCECGNPVWRISIDAYYGLQRDVLSAERNQRRKELLREAGGKHTKNEIQAILRLQEDRCIYCNSSFTPRLRPTRDHLFPVHCGGGDWALNIVMACGRCNARRGMIPFRNYCRLLGPRQNRRILRHLGRRLAVLEMDDLPDEAFACFFDGLRMNDPRHPRYIDICRISAVAKCNAAVNQLLPCSPHRILKKYFSTRRPARSQT